MKHTVSSLDCAIYSASLCSNIIVLWMHPAAVRRIINKNYRISSHYTVILYWHNISRVTFDRFFLVGIGFFTQRTYSRNSMGSGISVLHRKIGIFYKTFFV